MKIIIFFIGVLIGILLNIIIFKLEDKITVDNERKNKTLSKRVISSRIIIEKIIVVFFCGFLFLIGFLKFGINIAFIKFVLLCSISTVVSFIDLRYQIIPNSIVVLTLILGGAIFCIYAFEISFMDIVLGMLVGGGLLFALAQIPGAMGGGDVKFMFALGSFLGLYKTLWALFLAFVLASFISVLLLLFKVKGRKEHIPFGPFISMGALIAFYILT